MAYIQAIRSAQNFIYIENQYFLGSSYAWPSYKNAGKHIYIYISFTRLCLVVYINSFNLFKMCILHIYIYIGADNLIPMELALKIVSKIRAGERFCVYVIIPMWPEGVPSSAAVQEILYWQVIN